MATAALAAHVGGVVVEGRLLAALARECFVSFY